MCVIYLGIKHSFWPPPPRYKFELNKCMLKIAPSPALQKKANVHSLALFLTRFLSLRKEAHKPFWQEFWHPYPNPENAPLKIEKNTSHPKQAMSK